MKKSDVAIPGIALGLALLLGTVSAFAGGPLLLADPTTRTPFAYPAGTVDVFTDLGPMGLLTNEESDILTANGFAEWTAVPASFFAAAVAGDFSTLPLPDITGANAGLVIGFNNGGGIHVLYDDDGSIIEDFFGAPPGVLGIASPDFAMTGTAILTESWAVVNGTAVSPGDVGGASFGGVYTHEFGHAINLAHTQTNGAIIFFGDDSGPRGCPTPYVGLPTLSDTETMYPFIDPSPGSTGVQQATIEHPDDVAALSNVYPTGGWPGSFGTITGTIFRHDGTTEVTGVNVIARNVNAPFSDAVSALSGDFTQGFLGPDGLYTLHGLTPGADYVVYLDTIVAGGFSTPPIVPLPGPEEFWNDTQESADPAVDDRCGVATITAAAGSPATADVIFNVLGDHFTFYRTRITRGADRFFRFGPLTLADQFRTADYDVVRPLEIGLPADKNNEGRLDEDTHLMEYKLRPSPGTEQFQRIVDVRIINQCNDLLLSVTRPESILVPTNKDLVNPPPVPDEQTHNVDHFLCYTVRVQTRDADGNPLPRFPRKIQVDVTDQFQTRRYDLKKITKLCNPVDKSGDPDILAGPDRGSGVPITPATIRNPDTHLVCYQARLARRLIPQSGCGPVDPNDRGTPISQDKHQKLTAVKVNNQFRPEVLDTINESELCIPSQKVLE